MALTPLTGAATTTVKVSDYNALVTALNAELGLLASRITALENKPAPVIPPDLTNDLTALKERQASYEAQMGGRITILEGEPDVPDLTDRVLALENLIVRSPAESPTPQPMVYEPLAKPAGIDPDEPALVYDKATIYLGDMELHAQRIDATHWRLFAALNYITISQILWTYDEIVEGTPDEVYAHALGRLQELAELKPQHDAVHHRVVEMSEGR